MFLKCKDYECHIDLEINKAVKHLTSEEEKKETDSLCKARRMFMPQLLWKNLNNNYTTKSLYLSMMFFLHILLLISVSVVCVERLLFKMRLIKTCLRNLLSQVHFDQWLLTATESPKKSFSEDT